MEIDITDFFKNTETWDLSGSVATHGPNVAKQTWANAKKEGADSPLLKTEDELDAMRQWAKESGGWDKEEIAAWDAIELNALFMQLIAGDMREAGLDSVDFEDIDWADKGHSAGCIYKGDDDHVYYYLGS